MHSLFSGMLAKQIFAPLPGPSFGAEFNSAAIDEIESLLRWNAHDVAAVILEPIVQNAGGLRFHHPEYLRRLRALCDRHDVLLIFDEIATGFGRTGPLFGCEHAGVAPDIMCVGKAMTGGMITLAATLITEQIADVIARGEPGVFMHGPTYMGNPLACSAALANLELLFSYDHRARIAQIEAQLRAELAPYAQHDSVADVRVLGAIGVIELKERVDFARVVPALVERGVWLRPFGRLIYTMPPYVITPNELHEVTSAIGAVL
jgi:adenosylmethionine-8-amino-7-oxononanoate aminotransferase